MMRELNALKQQMASLQQLMQLQMEMQTDIQRAIRQEVSAAINASADERSHPPTGEFYMRFSISSCRCILRGE